MVSPATIKRLSEQLSVIERRALPRQHCVFARSDREADEKERELRDHGALTEWDCVVRFITIYESRPNGRL